MKPLCGFRALCFEKLFGSLPVGRDSNPDKRLSDMETRPTERLFIVSGPLNMHEGPRLNSKHSNLDRTKSEPAGISLAFRIGMLYSDGVYFQAGLQDDVPAVKVQSVCLMAIFDVVEPNMDFRIELEMYPGDWIEIDPRDLYDDQLVSLADHLEKQTVRPEKLNNTYWSMWDLTLPPKPIRVVRIP